MPDRISDKNGIVIIEILYLILNSRTGIIIVLFPCYGDCFLIIVRIGNNRKNFKTVSARQVCNITCDTGSMSDVEPLVGIIISRS